MLALSMLACMTSAGICESETAEEQLEQASNRAYDEAKLE